MWLGCHERAIFARGRTPRRAAQTTQTDWPGVARRLQIIAAMADVEGMRASTATNAADEPIVAVLERFFQYLAMEQPEPAVELWDLPALILGDSHVHGPMSRPQLERLLAEATPLARPESLAGQRPRAGSRQGRYVSAEGGVWLGERVARVRAHWPEQRFGGFLSGVGACEFLLRIDEGGLPKIRALTLLPPDFPRLFTKS